MKLKSLKDEKRAFVLEQERKIKELKDDEMTEDFSITNLDETKECPMCAESVKIKAKICRFCGYKFE